MANTGSAGAGVKVASDLKEATSRSGTIGMRQLAPGKEKSYQSFCPPKTSSPGTSTQLEIIQDVMGELQSKLNEVSYEVGRLSRRQEQFFFCLVGTIVLLLFNLLGLFMVKTCQSATEWYC